MAFRLQRSSLMLLECFSENVSLRFVFASCARYESCEFQDHFDEAASFFFQKAGKKCIGEIGPRFPIAIVKIFCLLSKINGSTNK